MKKLFLMRSGLLIGLVLLSINPAAIAQKGDKQKYKMDNPRHNGTSIHMSMPDLTEEQVVKIKELKTTHMKAMLKSKNELNEKHARLKTLQTAETVDMNKINKVIEEIGSIKTEMAKKRAALHQEIRELLSEEQRVHFDAKALNNKMYRKSKNSAHHKGRKMKW